MKKNILAVVAILGGALASSTALAHLANSYEVAYYSDASKTIQVGSKDVMCNGAATVYGTVTPYSTVINTQSCGDTGYECDPSSPYCFIS
jgi:hypothetical protein